MSKGTLAFHCIRVSILCNVTGQCAVQALSNTVWGFSKLEVVHEQLLDAVAAAALKKLHVFNGQNIANTVRLALFACTEMQL